LPVAPTTRCSAPSAPARTPFVSPTPSSHEQAHREISSRETAAGRETADLLRSVIAPGLTVQGRHFYAEGVCVAADARLDVGGDWYDVVEDDNRLVDLQPNRTTARTQIASMGATPSVSDQSDMMSPRPPTPDLDWTGFDLANDRLLSRPGCFSRIAVRVITRYAGRRWPG
jgi:hypothetical protein